MIVLTEIDHKIVVFLQLQQYLLPYLRNTVRLGHKLCDYVPLCPSVAQSPSLLIGYYLWCITNQTVLWVGHWARLQSGDYRQREAVVSEAKLQIFKLIYVIGNQIKKKIILIIIKCWISEPIIGQVDNRMFNWVEVRSLAWPIKDIHRVQIHSCIGLAACLVLLSCWKVNFLPCLRSQVLWTRFSSPLYFAPEHSRQPWLRK